MTVEGERPERAPRGHAAPQTRGFLFADIRGFTEYVEHYGAEAASDLLARYRTIVRTTIAEQAAAEIRTEGDSFYVVLPSASSAVICGLAILRAVDADNKAHPDQPIRVGIGVHAGEAIETDQGLVGTAVNIAARIAALARPGEVLVSETVRTLTRSVLLGSYVPRGRHRLKGVAEPQEVFAAMPAGAPVIRGRMRRLRAPFTASVGVGVLALVIGLVYVALPAGANPGAGATATPTLAAVSSGATAAAPTATAATATTSAGRPTASVAQAPTIIYVDRDLNPTFGGLRALSPGSYRYDSFRPILVFSVGPASSDQTWYPVLPGSDFTIMFARLAGVDSSWDPGDGVKTGMVVLNFVRLQTVFGNPCDPGDTTQNQALGGRPSDVVNWLSSQRFLSATNVQPASVAGWTGLSVEITVTGDPGIACAGLEVPHQGSVYVFKTAPVPARYYGGLYRIRDGDENRFTILDIGGDSTLVLIEACRLTDCPARLPWSQQLIDTMTAGGE
jgi:class 3 adenylate cyclase